MEKTRQKVYISYSHKEGTKYKEYLEETFKDLIQNKTVSDEDLFPQRGADFIDKLIKEEYIDEQTLVIVLISKSTRANRYVDWEIYTALEKKAYVVGVLLPGVKVDNKTITLAKIPVRLADNVKSGYSKLYTWNDTINNFETFLDVSNQNHINLIDNIKNTRQRILTSEEEFSLYDA